MNNPHDRQLARAFDGQAPKFERAPVQSDPVALAWLVRLAEFPEGARVLDAGCGPGLVSRAFLDTGCRVIGVDLSAEMVERARLRCKDFPEAHFLQASVFDRALDERAPFDAAVSRYVLHHVTDPRAFIARQAALLKPGGILALSDHVTDPSPALAAQHQDIEKMRDKSHTRNLTGDELKALLASASLRNITYEEQPFSLDFDEWFDRGTPSASKEGTCARLLSLSAIPSFTPVPGPDGKIRIDCIRCVARGVKP